MSIPVAAELALAVALALTQVAPSSAQVSPASADDLGPLPRHAAFSFPTRLLNGYFPELAFGYRRRLGPDGLWAVGATGGAVLRSASPRQGDSGGVWGFGVGVEGRRYWFDSPGRTFDPYFVAGVEASRAYYEATFGLDAVAGAEYDRLVETSMASRRHEGLLGVGGELTARSGFSVDFRVGLALAHWNYGARELDTAPPRPSSPFRRREGHENVGFLDFDRDRQDIAVFPRLRVGFGWRW